MSSKAIWYSHFSHEIYFHLASMLKLILLYLISKNTILVFPFNRDRLQGKLRYMHLANNAHHNAMKIFSLRLWYSTSFYLPCDYWDDYRIGRDVRLHFIWYLPFRRRLPPAISRFTFSFSHDACFGDTEYYYIVRIVFAWPFSLSGESIISLALCYNILFYWLSFCFSRLEAICPLMRALHIRWSLPSHYNRDRS